MKTLIKLEELIMLAVSIYALYLLKVDWWYYLILALGPDISMLGYLAGNSGGAVSYDIFHHKGIAGIVFLIGLFFNYGLIQVIGIILFGHSSMDRFFGYGLKYAEGFKYTHLGTIGKK